jgi:hypothetical protein
MSSPQNKTPHALIALIELVVFPASIVLLVVCLISGTSRCGSLLPPPPEPVSRKIVMKQIATEPRLGFDPGRGGWLDQTTTVYYLVAESGHVAEVGLSTFATAQPGQDYATTEWELK